MKGVVQICLERNLAFDYKGTSPSACKQASYSSKCASVKKAAVKEFEECKSLRQQDPQRFQNATIVLMELPDLSTVAYEAAIIECDCCNCVLGRQLDFLQQRSGIEEAYAKYNVQHNTNHHCLFLPKFHPELNYIERIWGRMKYYIRLHCDNKFETMCLNITSAMASDNLPVKLIRRFARTSFAYLFAYRGGKDIISAHEWVKKHRAHRSHSKQMDFAVDQSVDSRFDADLEQLYYPNGRPTIATLLVPVDDSFEDSDSDDDSDDGEMQALPEMFDAPMGDEVDEIDDIIEREDEEEPLEGDV